MKLFCWLRNLIWHSNKDQQEDEKIKTETEINLWCQYKNLCKQQTRQTEHFVYALIFHKFKIKGSKDIFCAFKNLIYLLNIKHKCVEIHKQSFSCHADPSTLQLVNWHFKMLTKHYDYCTTKKRGKTKVLYYLLVQRVNILALQHKILSTDFLHITCNYYCSSDCYGIM